MGQLHKLQHTYKRNTRRRGGKGTEEIFEVIMTENFPKLMTETKLETQEAQRTSSRTTIRKSAPRHIIFKLQKIKKEARGREKTLTYRGTKIRVTLDFSSETV